MCAASASKQQLQRSAPGQAAREVHASHRFKCVCSVWQGSYLSFLMCAGLFAGMVAGVAHAGCLCVCDRQSHPFMQLLLVATHKWHPAYAGHAQCMLCCAVRAMPGWSAVYLFCLRRCSFRCILRAHAASSGQARLFAALVSMLFWQSIACQPALMCVGASQPAVTHVCKRELQLQATRYLHSTGHSLNTQQCECSCIMLVCVRAHSAAHTLLLICNVLHASLQSW